MTIRAPPSRQSCHLFLFYLILLFVSTRTEASSRLSIFTENNVEAMKAYEKLQSVKRSGEGVNRYIKRDVVPKRMKAGMEEKQERDEEPSEPSKEIFDVARHTQRDDISKQERCASAHMHTITVIVKRKNIDTVIMRHLQESSDPFHPNFAHHLSREEIDTITSNPEAVQAVKEWVTSLSGDGVEIVSESPHGSAYITITGPVGVFERELSTAFYHFHQLAVQEKKVASKIVRATEFSLTPRLTEHVDAVFGVVDFPIKDERKAHATTTEQAPKEESQRSLDAVGIVWGHVTPALLQKYYGIASSYDGEALTTQAVYASIKQNYSVTDLINFQTRFGLPTSKLSNVGGHVMNGPCTQASSCNEANLDVQYITALASSVNTTFLYYDDGITDWLIKVHAMKNPPKVISISYGAPEYFFTLSELGTFHIEAALLAAQGVTLIAASGDDGVAGHGARLQYGGAWYCGYSPSFPASSPFVLSVGGTQGPESGLEEVVCQGDNGGVITSGGGFSDFYPRPWFQDSAVTSYLNSSIGLSVASGFSGGGRGYPDIAALAYNYQVLIGDTTPTDISGTSASAPVASAMISLINGARAKLGKSSVGWINPSLYRLAKTNYSSLFTDITKGINNCVSSGVVCCHEGFPAAAGWDPSSGLGSLKFPAVLATYSALGSLTFNASLTVVTNHTAYTKPSYKSSTMPSPMPTAAPGKMKGGWLTQSSFTSDDCSGLAVTVDAVPTSTCLQVSNKKYTFYVKYFCYGSYATALFYSESKCPPSSIINFMRQPRWLVGCDQTETVAYSDVYTSSRLNCSSDSSSTPPLWTALEGGDYVVQQTYTSYPSCDGAVSQYQAQHIGTCMPTGDGQSFMWVKSGNSLVQNTFTSSSSCSGKPITKTAPTDCQKDLANDDLNNMAYQLPYSVEMSYTMSTFYLPSMPPTARPTALPTAIVCNVFMAVTQTLNGISATNFEASPSIALTFRQTVAAILGSGILYNSVTITSVTDTLTTSSFSRQLVTGPVAISISYTVSQTVNVFGSSSSAYSILSLALQNSVSSGAFTSTLQSLAMTNGALALTSVTATSPPNIVSSLPSNDTKEPLLTTTQIITIVVVIGGCCVLTLAAYALYRCMGGGSDKIKVPTTDTDAHRFGDPFDQHGAYDLELRAPAASAPPDPYARPLHDPNDYFVYINSNNRNNNNSNDPYNYNQRQVQTQDYYPQQQSPQYYNTQQQKTGY